MTTESRPWKPEEELLLCCAGTHMDAKRAERVRALLAEQLDWPYLLRMAHPHGMSPLLSRNLGDVESGRVPDVIRTQLHDRVMKDIRHNLHLAGELGKILDSLEQEGIPVIPLKGPVLAAALYSDLALRPSRDLDLLVRREDVPRATTRLLEQGYRRRNPIPSVRETAFFRAESEWTLEHAATGTLVDLHWRVTPPYFACRLDLDRWRARAEQTAFGGRLVLTLPKEETLLLLCVHGAKHCWERLEWVCDVARLVERADGMQWDGVLEQARAAGAIRMLRLGLLLAAELADAPVPQDLLREARSDSAAKALAARVRARLFRDGQRSWRIGEATFFHLRAKERWRDKACYVIRMATPRLTDWAEWPLSTTGVWPYYLLRPVRLAVKHGGRWLRQLGAPRTATCDHSRE